jgi:8-oxo-dGTP diphosphatase
VREIITIWWRWVILGSSFVMTLYSSERGELIEGGKMMDAPKFPENLRSTHAVTCVLLRTDQPETRMLLVRRSQKVGSYRGYWASISGFIEPGVAPEEQAYTEIREETGLQRDQVRLLRCGAVVEHGDAKLGRLFCIHPFLFEALTPDMIRLDWEATEMRWVVPSELSSFETVPKLQEVYESALHGYA